MNMRVRGLPRDSRRAFSRRRTRAMLWFARQDIAERQLAEQQLRRGHRCQVADKVDWLKEGF